MQIKYIYFLQVVELNYLQLCCIIWHLKATCVNWIKLNVKFNCSVAVASFQVFSSHIGIGMQRYKILPSSQKSHWSMMICNIYSYTWFHKIITSKSMWSFQNSQELFCLVVGKVLISFLFLAVVVWEIPGQNVADSMIFYLIHWLK